MKKTVVAVCLFGALVVGGASAEGDAVNAIVVGVPEVRTAPPHGPFHLFVGNEIKNSVEVGEHVKILATNRYYGFEGTHLWHRIQPPGDGRDPVWAYAGVAENRKELTILEAGAIFDDPV